jgi:hypothetical protein
MVSPGNKLTTTHLMQVAKAKKNVQYSNLLQLSRVPECLDGANMESQSTQVQMANGQDNLGCTCITTQLCTTTSTANNIQEHSDQKETKPQPDSFSGFKPESSAVSGQVTVLNESFPDRVDPTIDDGCISRFQRSKHCAEECVICFADLLKPLIKHSGKCRVACHCAEPIFHLLVAAERNDTALAVTKSAACASSQAVLNADFDPFHADWPHW